MDMPENEKYYLSNAYGSMIFNPAEDLYEGSDGKIYIGACESAVYGTSKAAEGYDEEPVDSFDDVKDYFKPFDIISRKTDQCDYKVVDKEQFFEMLQDRYNEIEAGLEL